MMIVEKKNLLRWDDSRLLPRNFFLEGFDDPIDLWQMLIYSQQSLSGKFKFAMFPPYIILENKPRFSRLSMTS